MNKRATEIIEGNVLAVLLAMALVNGFVYIKHDRAKYRVKEIMPSMRS